MTTQKSSIKKSGNVKSLRAVNEENNVNELGNEIVRTNADKEITIIGIFFIIVTLVTMILV